MVWVFVVVLVWGCFCFNFPGMYFLKPLGFKAFGFIVRLFWEVAQRKDSWWNMAFQLLIILLGTVWLSLGRAWRRSLHFQHAEGCEEAFLQRAGERHGAGCWNRTWPSICVCECGCCWWSPLCWKLFLGLCVCPSVLLTCEDLSWSGLATHWKLAHTRLQTSCLEPALQFWRVSEGSTLTSCRLWSVSLSA